MKRSSSHSICVEKIVFFSYHFRYFWALLLDPLQGELILRSLPSIGADPLLHRFFSIPCAKAMCDRTSGSCTPADVNSEDDWHSTPSRIFEYDDTELYQLLAMVRSRGLMELSPDHMNVELLHQCFGEDTLIVYDSNKWVLYGSLFIESV